MTTLGEEVIQTALEDSLRDSVHLSSNPPPLAVEGNNLRSLFSIGNIQETFIAKNKDMSLAQSTPAQECKPPPLDQPTEPPTRYSIDDCIREIHERCDRQATNTYAISEEDGDTLIFIDPPPMQFEQSDVDFKHYLRYHQEPIVMKSSRLKAASEVFKARLEDPTGQYRAIRRRGLVNKLSGYHKFVLDLTPPVEGEDAVYLTATLSCPETVRLWYLAGQIWDVSDTLVGGAEDYAQQSPTKSPHVRSPLVEYSPIRHRCAIERVLAAIQGLDLKLNSAVKVWTTSVIAQYFGIKNAFLEDSIVSWLRPEPNYYFFEVNPEITLRIGVGFENPDVTRDAFAILVGEEALDSQYRMRAPVISREQRSTFGRKKDALPETLQERIEYASKSFIERNTKNFEHLIDKEMKWLCELPAMQQLTAYDSPELQRHASSLMVQLKSYVRSAICKVLCSKYPGVPGPGRTGAPTESLVPHCDRTKIWSTLQPKERILTCTFWDSLKLQNLIGNMSNYSFRTEWRDDATWAARPYHLETMKGLCICGSQYHKKSTSSLRLKVEQGQVMFDQIRAGKTPCSKSTDVDNDASRIIEGSGVSERVTQKLSELEIWDDIDESTSLSRLQETAELSRNDIVQLDNDPSSSNGLVGMDDQGRSHAPKVDPSSAPTLNGYIAPTDSSTWCKGTNVMENESGWQDAPSLIVTAHADTEKAPLSQKRFRAKLPKAATIPSLSLSGVDAEEPSYSFFNLPQFFLEASKALINYADLNLAPSDASLRQYPYVPTLINTLTSLSDSEWKYLPLWAGGCDDDTGAVFTDDIMETAPDAGFAPGHGIHTLGSACSSEIASSDDYDMTSDAGTDIYSSRHTSTAVNDGFSDQMHRHIIYTPSSSSCTDDSLMLRLAAENEEENARRQVEALERAQAEEAKAAAQKRKTEFQERREEINYDDMFNGMDDDEEDGVGHYDSDGDSNATETGEGFEDVGAEEFVDEDGDGVMV
ncbi:MAG: hypothetical protein Q9164_006580 [Protoblastenia rupestris]